MNSFAVIGDYAVAVLSDKYVNQPEKLEQEALENMEQLRNTPPDFSTYVMDDGYGLVEMNYGIYAVSSEPLSDKEIKEGKVSLATALAVRGSCLDACEKGEVIAINDMGEFYIMDISKEEFEMVWNDFSMNYDGNIAFPDTSKGQ